MDQEEINQQDTQNSQNDSHTQEHTDDVEFEEITGEGDSLQARDVIKKLKEKLRISEEKNKEYLDNLHRMKADYINLKKRGEEERAEIGKYVKETTVSDFIPVIESFDMAFSNKELWEKIDPTWRNGVEYIYKQFIEILTSYGLKEMNPLGEKFDAQLHTAIESVHTDNEHEDHVVAAVLQKGYMLNNKLIRSPKVKVFNHSSNE